MTGRPQPQSCKNIDDIHCDAGVLLQLLGIIDDLVTDAVLPDDDKGRARAMRLDALVRVAHQRCENLVADFDEVSSVLQRGVS